MMTNFLPLYIDPGTGSMLFSLSIGLAATLVFGARALLIKIKSFFGRGKQSALDKSHLGIVIYSDSKRYWNVFGPVAHEFEKRGVPLVYYTQSADDPALGEQFNSVKTEFIGEGNKGFAKMNFLNADVCLATTPGLDVLQWKRSRDCAYYVHVPHMFNDNVATYRMLSLDFYDAVLLTADIMGEDVRRLESIRKLPAKELRTVGYPPIDEQKKRLDATNEHGKGGGKTTILVAPSWGANGILAKFGARFLAAAKATGFDVVIRPHPQSVTSEKVMLDSLMREFPESEHFHWNFDNDNFNCMNEASILISDFSGIIFEFALLFDKPVLYADTSFNPSVYEAAWLEGETLWCFSVLDKIGIKLREEQFDDMRRVIENARVDSELKAGRDEVRNEAWTHRGESAKLIADYLIEKQKSLQEMKREESNIAK